MDADSDLEEETAIEDEAPCNEDPEIFLVDANAVSVPEIFRAEAKAVSVPETLLEPTSPLSSEISLLPS